LFHIERAELPAALRASSLRVRSRAVPASCGGLSPPGLRPAFPRCADREGHCRGHRGHRSL